MTKVTLAVGTESGFETRLTSGLRKHKVRDLGRKGKYGRSWEAQGAKGSRGPREHGAVGTGAGRRLPDLCPITSVTRAPTPGQPLLSLIICVTRPGRGPLHL